MVGGTNLRNYIVWFGPGWAILAGIIYGQLTSPSKLWDAPQRGPENPGLHHVVR